MVLCHAALQLETTSLLQILLDMPLSKVPSQYKTQHDRWHVIQNPASEISLEYDLTQTVSNIRYVTKTFFLAAKFAIQ